MKIYVLDTCQRNVKFDVVQCADENIYLEQIRNYLVIIKKLFT